jgi:hypothetical protein
MDVSPYHRLGIRTGHHTLLGSVFAGVLEHR